MTRKELIDKMAALICDPSKDNLSKPMWQNGRVGLSNGHIGIVFNDIEYCTKWGNNDNARLFEACEKECL